jgi:hypothetical protein
VLFVCCLCRSRSCVRRRRVSSTHRAHFLRGVAAAIACALPPSSLNARVPTAHKRTDRRPGRRRRRTADRARQARTQRAVDRAAVSFQGFKGDVRLPA